MLARCALAPSVAREVDACRARFPELDTRGVTSTLAGRLALTRATQRYASALTYARMILAQHGLPQLEAGRERVFALLFDMNVLWERYIAALIRRPVPAGLEVHAQERHAFWLPARQAVRQVRLDIVVRKHGLVLGEVVAVIDTKWKVPSGGAPSVDDLRQMVIYNELLRAPRSILLYPQTAASRDVRGGYATKEHGCEQRHLGLSNGQAWSRERIQAQLHALIMESL
jgi:5-methylcytosine-specific restriction enzyme subunit McrC